MRIKVHRLLSAKNCYARGRQCAQLSQLVSKKFLEEEILVSWCLIAKISCYTVIVISHILLYFLLFPSVCMPEDSQVAYTLFAHALNHHRIPW